MELVPGGELFEYVADSGRFSEEAARTYFRILIESNRFYKSLTLRGGKFSLEWKF